MITASHTEFLTLPLIRAMRQTRASSAKVPDADTI